MSGTDDIDKQIDDFLDSWTDNMGGEVRAEQKQELKALIANQVKQARQDQTFKVIQSLVKSGAISDTAASNALSLFIEMEDV